MRVVHLVIGWAVVGGFGLLWLWGLGAWLVNRLRRRVGGNRGRVYWYLLGFLQGTLLVQGVGGVVLLFAGGSASLLHIVYGVVFPVLVLAVAHVLAREMFAERPWVAFSWAAFFVFGLTGRALMTGLGYP